MVNDTLETLRPKMKLFSSFAEANEAALELSKEYEDKISTFANKILRRRVIAVNFS